MQQNTKINDILALTDTIGQAYIQTPLKIRQLFLYLRWKTEDMFLLLSVCLLQEYDAQKNRLW